MLTLKLKGMAKYQKLAERFRRAQEKGKLKGILPRILKTFVEESYSKDPFNLGIPADRVRSVESNARDTIDVLFDDVYSPWLHLRFFNDYEEVMIRGGLAVYEYILEDEHCDPLMWEHSFYSLEKLDTALMLLAMSGNIIRLSEVQPYNRIITVDNQIIITPARFPRSSATRTASYLPPRDFEIREEVLPVKHLNALLAFLRDNIPAEPHPNGFSVVYSEPVDPSKIDRGDYQGPKTFRIDIK